MKMFSFCSYFFIIALTLLSCTDTQEKTDKGISTLTAIDEIPTIHQYKYIKFSSFDRDNSVKTPVGDYNKDFNHCISLCGNESELPWLTIEDDQCETNDFGYLLAKIKNRAGFISRMWFAKLPNETRDEFWDDEMIEIYVDDQIKPAINIRLQDLDHGNHDPLSEPLVGHRSGGTISYFPISFNSNLKVLVNNFSPLTTLFYYHIDITLIDGETFSYSFPLAQRETDTLNSARNLLSQLGDNPFTAQELIDDTLTITSSQNVTLFSFPQDGTLTSLSLVIPKSEFKQLHQLFLLFDWKNGVSSKEIPVSAFFGLGFEPKDYHSLLLGTKIIDDNIIMQSYIPMPSNKGGTISLLNKNPKTISIDMKIGWNKTLPPKPHGYFSAQFNEIKSPKPETTHLPIANFKRKGKYLGTFYFLKGKSDPEFPFPDPYNFLEGDDKIIIDDTDTLHGTGTEEIMDSAWYFKNTFDSAFAGLNHKKTLDDIGEIGGYRWYLFANELSFQSSFEFTQEIGNRKPELALHYRWVSYYYLLP